MSISEPRSVRDRVDFHFLSFIHPFPHRLCCTHRVGKTAIGSRDGELPGLTPLQRLPTSLYSQRQEKDLDVPSFCTFKYTPSAQPQCTELARYCSFQEATFSNEKLLLKFRDLSSFYSFLLREQGKKNHQYKKNSKNHECKKNTVISLASAFPPPPPDPITAANDNVLKCLTSILATICRSIEQPEGKSSQESQEVGQSQDLNQIVNVL